MKMNIKNMKTVWGAWICLGLLVPTACSDMFETDSTSVVFESGNRLDSPMIRCIPSWGYWPKYRS